MKTIPAGLTNHLALGTTSIAYGMRITRTDNTVYAFTSNSTDDLISGVTYLSDPGLDVTNIVIAASLAVGNLELTTLHDGSVFSTIDIFNGVWTNAAFVIFRYNVAGLTDGVETLLTGTLGELQLNENTVVAELRDLRQYMQQSIGDVTSKTCRARLGDARCTKDLTSFTYTGTITSFTSNQVFRDNTRAEAVNWFDEGEFFFTSGPNAGIRMKIKSYAANGTFTLALPLFGTVAIGHAYTAIAGCRKRLEDCRDKFDNVLNFVGEPHRKGLNNITQSPSASV